MKPAALGLALLALACLSACSRPHDDGMGDLWKGVKYCNEGHCR
jgi:hypothetical protein